MAPGFARTKAAGCKVAEGREEGSPDPSQQRAPPSAVRPTPASIAGRSGRWRFGQEQRANPDTVRQEARERVAKLQRALEVLGETSGPEVDGLRSALEKARKLASEPAVEVQISECKGTGREAGGRVGRSVSSGVGVPGRRQSQAATSRGRSRTQGSGSGQFQPGGRRAHGLGSGGAAASREGQRVAGSELGGSKDLPNAKL